jgi:hypothetical protein
MKKWITPDVLRDAAEGLTQADARPLYGKVEYMVVESWTPIFGSTLVAALLHHDPADPGFLSPAQVRPALVAQVVGEVARVVAILAAVYNDPHEYDAVDAVTDALEGLVTELAQVRTEPHPSGTLILFVSTRDG